MLRILLFAVAIGVTLYAILDWAFTSRRYTPGDLNRWIWLAVIIMLPILGPTTWVILRQVGLAEGRQNPPQPGPIAPDDNPEFLSDMAKKIKRRQKKQNDD